MRVDAPGTAAVEDLPAPEPGDAEVTVRVGQAGLCATDRKLYARGANPARVPGHEVAGTGPDGTRVVVHPDTGCGSCESCVRGWENRCADRVSVGLQRDGGLAERVTVPARHVIALDGVDPRLAPLLEPLACCVHAVERLRVEEGEPALVVGAGAMGLLAMWALRAHGASVAVCQRSERRRQLAAELGADAVCAPGEDVATALGKQPRAAIVTAPGADPLGLALEQVAVGGRVHAFAGTPGGATVDANVVHYRHLDLVGSTGSGTRDIARARDLVAGGSVPLADLPVEWVTLEEVPGALDRSPREPALKTLVRVGADGEAADGGQEDGGSRAEARRTNR